MVRQSSRAATRTSSLATCSLLNQEATRPRRKSGPAPDTVARREGVRGVPLTAVWLEANQPLPRAPFPETVDSTRTDTLATNPTPPQGKLVPQFPVAVTVATQPFTQVNSKRVKKAAEPLLDSKTFSHLQLVVRLQRMLIAVSEN